MGGVFQRKLDFGCTLKTFWPCPSVMNEETVPKMLIEVGPIPLITSLPLLSFRDGFQGLELLKDNCLSLLVFLNHLGYFLGYNVLEDIKLMGRYHLGLTYAKKCILCSCNFPLWYIVLRQKKIIICVFIHHSIILQSNKQLFIFNMHIQKIPWCFFCKKSIISHRTAMERDAVSVLFGFLA